MGASSKHNLKHTPERAVTGPAAVRLIALLVVLTVAAVVMVLFGLDQTHSWLVQSAESPWGPVAFVGLYLILVVLMVPGSLGTAAAGAIFGTWVGFGSALVGAAIGATIAFQIARHVGREGAVGVLGDRTRAVDEWLTTRGLRAIVILRLLPVVPFNALNYAAGMSGLRFRDYVIGSVVGMAPGTFVLAMLAAQAREPMGAGFLTALATAVAGLVASAIAGTRLRRRLVE